MVSESNLPSVQTLLFPGYRTPYLKSRIGFMFYLVLAIFVGISASIYFAVQEGRINLSTNVMWSIIVAILILGIFIADRYQFTLERHGGLLMQPSSIESKQNMIMGDDTDGKSGSQRGSGIQMTMSMWVMDKGKTESTRPRWLISRETYSKKDLEHIDEHGNTVPTKGDNGEILIQSISKQPGIYLNDTNHVIVSLQDTSSQNKNAISTFKSSNVIPRNEWTLIQVVQSQDDISIYVNSKLDSVHTFKPIQDPELISKGRLVLFPVYPEDSIQFNGLLSRIYYFNRGVSASVLTDLYNMGPVQGSLPYELLKGILGIPMTLAQALFMV